MEIVTRRFGRIGVEPDAIIRFPRGLFGLENCHDWVLLADTRNNVLAWLQSVEQPEVALAVVSPRRFMPDFRIRVARCELAPLELEDAREAQVLVVVGKTDRAMTLNLKAPLVLNLQRRLGRQVITNGDLPVQHELTRGPSALRRTA